MAVKAPAARAAAGCPVNDITRANNQVSADFIATHVDYLEFNPVGGSPFDSEKGWLPGVRIGASVMTSIGALCNLYVSGSFSYRDSHTQYWAAGGPVTSATDGAKVEEWDFRAGKGFSLSANTMLTPYVGVGTRWWDRFLPGATGYDEVYKHAYVGGGLLLQWAPVQRLVLSANGLVGTTFNANMSLSDTPGGAIVPPYTFTLGDKTTYRVGGSADYAFTEHLHGNVGVEYTHFAYGQSAINPFGFLEPSSRTNQVTVSAGLGWGW